MERDNLMHGARTALNTDTDIRAWAENYLKEKTRLDNTQMGDEEFEKYWKYHKPEIMHTGAAEAMAAWRSREEREKGRKGDGETRYSASGLGSLSQGV